ncbi:hypothetical protein [Streptomyces yangpuensis]|uniref:hypothetical protein n=1 Tax=Streptomyces yangpuensis TaxID=1648182 RepID=UPI003826CC1C
MNLSGHSTRVCRAGPGGVPPGTAFARLAHPPGGLAVVGRQPGGEQFAGRDQLRPVAGRVPAPAYRQADEDGVRLGQAAGGQLPADAGGHPAADAAQCAHGPAQKAADLLAGLVQRHVDVEHRGEVEEFPQQLLVAGGEVSPQFLGAAQPVLRVRARDAERVAHHQGGVPEVGARRECGVHLGGRQA